MRQVNNPAVNPSNPASWPKKVRQAVDSIANVLKMTYILARERVTGTARLLAERDAALNECRQLRRENDILRHRIEKMEPSRRPQYAPADRLAILQLIWRNCWTAAEAARRFVLSERTVQRWIRIFQGRADLGAFFGRAPHNKYSDAVRWLVHEIKERSPEPECGTRTIASQIMQAGISLSRSAAQRFLKEKKPRPSSIAKAVAPEPGKTMRPFHILRPKTINRTWHLDFTDVRILFFHVQVVALLDGFSRKLLALKVYRSAPNIPQVLRLVRHAIREHGVPRFLVTDHGGQFGKRFEDAVKAMGIAPVQGKVRTCTFNGKAERFFKTLKLWHRLSLACWGAAKIQQRLDIFRDWYNTRRPHQSLNGMTPEQRWSGKIRLNTTPILALDPVQPAITVARRGYKGDPHLPIYDINVSRPAADAA